MLVWLLLSVSVHASELWLRVGEVRTIAAAPDAEVRIGKRGVIRAVDSESGLKLIGLKPGATSLAISGRSYMIRVSHAAQKEFQLDLRKRLGAMMGLKLYSDEKTLQIRGTLLRFSDWQELAESSRRFQGEYEFRAQALPDVAEAAMKHFRELARKNALPIMRFSASPTFTLHIPRAVRGLKSNAKKIFGPYGIQIEISDSDLAIAPLIRTRVVLAEVSKSFSREFGIAWPSEYKAQVLPRFSGEEGLLASLRALEARGQAQVLASPTLLCRSGGKAHFHAGGEFPIRMISRGSRAVLWKPHGVLLNVRPRADFQGALSIEVETEISMLDLANAVDGVPALRKNTVKSHFDLPGKRTIALSGLLRQELGRSRDGLPLLSSLPVLGALFSSRRYLNRQSELVVFVTPEVHTPDDKLEMPEGWVKDEF